MATWVSVLTMTRNLSVLSIIYLHTEIDFQPILDPAPARIPNVFFLRIPNVVTTIQGKEQAAKEEDGPDEE